MTTLERLYSNLLLAEKNLITVGHVNPEQVNEARAYVSASIQQVQLLLNDKAKERRQEADKCLGK